MYSNSVAAWLGGSFGSAFIGNPTSQKAVINQGLSNKSFNINNLQVLEF